MTEPRHASAAMGMSRNRSADDAGGVSAPLPSPNLCVSTDSPVISIPHLSFATDLLFNVDDVRANCAHGLTTQQNLVAMLKARIALERSYANELAKMAQQSHLDDLEHGTLRDALGSLKAQYLNTSVQHRMLAKNLEEDVLKPIDALCAHNQQKAQNLQKLVNNIKKQAKAHEDTYKKDYAAFDKHFRDATVAFATAMDAGFSSTVIEQQYHRQLAQLHKTADAQRRGSFGLKDAAMAISPTAASSTMNGSKLDPRQRQKSLTTIQSVSGGQKLVNWLLASEQQRKDNLYATAVSTLEAAEVSRKRCQRSWEGVETSRIEMYQALQSVLTEYQQMTEHRISNLTTNLRKHVVFESSALANEQYDWQMIASKIESVDFEGDIRAFIRKYQSQLLLDLTVNDLCHNVCGSSFVTSPTATKSYRPLKKTPLSISDLALRRIPFDPEGNQEPLPELLVTRLAPPQIVQQPVVPQRNPQNRADDAIRVGPVDSSVLRVQVDPVETAADSNVDGMDDAACRVSLAQDVARAIARAYEVRAVHKIQNFDMFITDNAGDLDNNGHLDNGAHSVQSPVQHPTTALYGNNTDEDAQARRTSSSAASSTDVEQYAF